MCIILLCSYSFTPLPSPLVSFIPPNNPISVGLISLYISIYIFNDSFSLTYMHVCVTFSQVSSILFPSLLVFPVSKYSPFWFNVCFNMCLNHIPVKKLLKFMQFPLLILVTSRTGGAYFQRVLVCACILKYFLLAVSKSYILY